MMRDQPNCMWAIPPPFSTNTSGASFPLITNRESTSSLKQSRTQRVDKHVRYKIETSPIRSDEMIRGRRRGNNRQLLSSNQEHWMPATKHKHSYSGCAPNGMRLFDTAPSLLLSKTQKMNRDKQMRNQLAKLRNDIEMFEESSNMEMGNVKSLTTLSATHGKMIADMREMQQVTDLRCASRWEPGLGRRQLHQQGLRSLRPLL